jgi:phosphoglycerol transferase MdoB-like AlkP superfamily enzyme
MRKLDPKSGPADPLSQIYNGFYALFIAYFLSFTIVRIWGESDLGLYLLPSLTQRNQARLVGFFGDIWIAFILAFIGFLLVLMCRKLSQKIPILLLWGWLVIWVVPLAFLPHYYSFFRTTVGIHHLEYLTDLSFLKSNTDSLMKASFLTSSLIPITIFAISHHLLRKRFRTIPPKTMVFTLLITALGAGGSQVFKNLANTKHIGWRVPTLFSVNPVEISVLQLAVLGNQPPYSPDQFGFPTDMPKSKWGLLLKQNLEKPNLVSPTPLGKTFQDIISEHRHTQKPLFVFLLMLESLRPLESKFYHPDLKESHMPFLDEILAGGITFTNAYTSGGVTRAGQEAALCGNLVGEFTSAMRNQAHLRPYCLSSIWKDQNLGSSHWWHGGDFSFDGQGSFWKRQEFSQVITNRDFPASPFSTYWGLPDHTLFRRILKDLPTTLPENQVQLHFVLTVTHHPNWEVPINHTDLERQSPEQNSAAFPHLPTLRYSDAAVEEFLKGLKKIPCATPCEPGETIWDHSLVILNNDHGHLMPGPLEPQGMNWSPDPASLRKAAEAQSKALLTIQGGLTEKVLKKLKIPSYVDHQYRSQQDIFATIIQLLQLDSAESTGDSLFSTQRRWPVVVDLGKYVFFPENPFGQQLWIRSEVPRQPDHNGYYLFHGTQALIQMGLIGHPGRD